MLEMKRHMLFLVFALVAAMPFCAARAARIAALPSPEQCAFADAESSTNIVLAVDRAKLFSLGFTIELSPSTTNCLEIALGADSDGDGELSPEESDVLFGYDCGEWFMRNGDGAEVSGAASGVRIVRPYGGDCIASGGELSVGNVDENRRDMRLRDLIHDIVGSRLRQDDAVNRFAFLVNKLLV
jgi:hypothetical protein